MTKAEFDKIKAAKLANPTAGRGVLARLAGVSENLTQQFLKKNVRITLKEAAAAKDCRPEDKATESTPLASSGISLKNARVSDFKPQDTVKRKLYELKRGTAYPISSISEQWGISEERIRKDAKRFECMKFVEVKPGDWVSCVIHPDTASEINHQRKG